MWIWDMTNYRCTDFGLLYSNSICRQSSIPTSILRLGRRGWEGERGEGEGEGKERERGRGKGRGEGERGRGEGKGRGEGERGRGEGK